MEQFGVKGKRELKAYWEDIMREHDRMVADAQEQVEEFKRAMV